MARITITLTPEEKLALVSYAKEQRRDPREQAAIELQNVLKRSGYLPSTVTKSGGNRQPVTLRT